MATKVSSCNIVFFTILFNLAQLYVSAHEASAFEFLNSLHGSHKGDNIEGIDKLKRYLHDFGYINVDSDNADITSNIFDDSLEFALKKYQSFYNLKITGVLDHKTMSLMSQPRCGVPDFPTEKPDYSFFEDKSKWSTYNLTYTLANMRNDAYDPIRKALEDWASVSPFRFRYLNDDYRANLKMGFQPIDGPQKALAYSYEPTDGLTIFDEAEKWVNGEIKDGFDIQSVAVHEIGHLLGLNHTTDSDAVMYPYFRADSTRRELQSDDIEGLKALYDF